MKLALFSQEVNQKHIEKLKSIFNQPLNEVDFLYINTPGNYKPFKSEWMIKGEQRWRNIFPKFQEFDLERAYRVDPNFNFSDFYNKFDFLYISGGNAFILNYWMKKTGSKKIITDLVKADKIVYGGESAGAIYAYKEIDTYKELDHPEKAPEVIYEALGLIDFAPIPHWENPEFQTGLESIKSKFDLQSVKTIPITDNQAIFVEDSTISIL